MSRLFRPLAAAVTAMLALSGCSSVIAGHGTSGLPPVAANANIAVVGDSGSAFDQTMKNAIADVEAFWKEHFPSVSNGKAFNPISGKYWSVMGNDPGEAARQEACLKQDDTVAIDNAFYCRLDDSVVWDRDPNHLVPVLGAKYGDFFTAMVVAHEFGHAIQERLKIFDSDPKTILTESQADCAAGAFTADMLQFKTPHFRVSPEQLNSALNGFFQVRDKSSSADANGSHGNGFDRISALADGMNKGVTYCYSDSYFTSRKFTERPFVDPSDYQRGGNQCLQMVINPAKPTQNPSSDCEGGGGLQPDLNRFWVSGAKLLSKTWQEVKVADAPHPACQADSASQFGYCPSDNTVYFDKTYAQRAYYSVTSVEIEDHTNNAKVVENQAADYGLGELFAIGWGMAARHQLFGLGLDDRDALISAICYSGAYAKDINKETGSFVLSPPDMDEATSTLLNLVGDDNFGARGTSGIERIQAFTKGYAGGLSSC